MTDPFQSEVLNCSSRQWRCCEIMLTIRVLLTCAVVSAVYAMVMSGSLASQTPLEVPVPSLAQKTALQHTFSIFIHYSICT